jgi:hypothetical protein
MVSTAIVGPAEATCQDRSGCRARQRRYTGAGAAVLVGCAGAGAGAGAVLVGCAGTGAGAGVDVGAAATGGGGNAVGVSTPIGVTAHVEKCSCPGSTGSHCSGSSCSAHVGPIHTTAATRAAAQVTPIRFRMASSHRGYVQQARNDCAAIARNAPASRYTARRCLRRRRVAEQRARVAHGGYTSAIHKCIAAQLAVESEPVGPRL